MYCDVVQEDCVCHFWVGSMLVSVAVAHIYKAHQLRYMALRKVFGNILHHVFAEEAKFAVHSNANE